MTAMKITNELVEKVDKVLRENNVWATEVYRSFDYFGAETLVIEISWGDWKHDHLRAKWVVEDVLGLNVVSWNETVTEENGSDCYSATHTVWLGE